MKAIDEKLNIGELIKVEKENLPVETSNEKELDNSNLEMDQEEFETDFDKSLDILEETLETARTSLEHIVEIAKQDESPKAFDSVTNLLRTMNQTAKLMLEMHEKRQKYKHNNIKLKDTGGEKPSSVTNTQVNGNINVFTGTTQELEKLASEIPEIQAIEAEYSKNSSN